MRNICHVIIMIILEQQYDSIRYTYIYINTSTYRGHIQLSIEIFVCKAAWKALVVCSPWRASSRRNTHHTHAADTHTHAHTNTHTHTGTAYAESC